MVEIDQVLLGLLTILNFVKFVLENLHLRAESITVANVAVLCVVDVQTKLSCFHLLESTRRESVTDVMKEQL